MLVSLNLGALEWIETTQADFKDGEYEVNLYASYRGGGAVEFSPHFDFNDDGWLDIFVPGDNGIIYWGSAQGFSETKTLTLPNGWGGCSAADLNIDGFTDLVLSPCKDGNNYIYWGSTQGFRSNDSTCLAGNNDQTNESNFIADLNKDGYLDIIASADYNHGSIYWGSRNGYSYTNRTDLPAYAIPHSIEVADFNKDGWLDIIFMNAWGGNQYIYYGTPQGLDSLHFTIIQFPPSGDISPHGCSVADLNNDGWLDVIFTGYQTITQTQIFWGSSQGFKQNNNQLLDQGAYAFGGSYIVDFNKDGYLDIVVFRNDAAAPLVFFGSPTGYSSSDTKEIGSSIGAASGGSVVDYNQDGNWDVFAIDFGSDSKIFWGPDYHSQDIPHGGHHGMTREIGNVYDRHYREFYTSSVFDAQGFANWGIITWIDSLPPGSAITMEVRTGNTSKPDSAWSIWTSVANGGLIPTTLKSRYIQYRATFTYANPCYLPVLFEVRIIYGFSTVGIIVEPDQTGSTDPGVTKVYALWVMNYGQSPDVVDMTTTSTGTDWKVELFDSTGANRLVDSDHDGMMDVGAVDSAGGKVNFMAQVIPPLTVQAGEVDTTIITGHSSNDPKVTDAATLITRIGFIAGITIEPDQQGFVRSGMIKAYTLTVTNLGNSKDVANIKIIRNSTNWHAEVYDSTGKNTLQDHNSDGIPDIDSLAPAGGKGKLVVKITPPKIDWLTGVTDTSQLIIDTTVVAAHSTRYPAVGDTAVLITTLGPGLDIHNYENPFIDTTRFVFSLPEEGSTTLELYSQAGERLTTIISNQKFSMGRHTVPWFAKNDGGRRLAPGLYIYLFRFKKASGVEEKIINKLVILPRTQ